jgi:hypothetical protein
MNGTVTWIINKRQIVSKPITIILQIQPLFKIMHYLCLILADMAINTALVGENVLANIIRIKHGQKWQGMTCRKT